MDAKQTQPSNSAGDSDRDISNSHGIDEPPNDSDSIQMRKSDEVIEQSPRRFENLLPDNKCDIEKKEETTENITKSITDSDEDYKKDEASENITKSIPDSDEDYKKEETTENITKSLTDSDEDYKKDETSENITKSITDSDEDYKKEETTENITKSIIDSDEDYKKEEMKENITKSLTDSEEDNKKEKMTENIMKNITDCDEDHQNDFHDFLNRLGLESFYPEKITLMDVTTVQPTNNASQFADIPWIVLRNLMMINSTSRDKMVEELLEKIPNDTFSSSQIDLSGNSIIDDIFSELDMCETQDSVNPIDIILAIFKCSSPALKGILAAKMFMCKLAIPFMFPCENKTLMLSYSPLHSIVLDDINDEGGMIQKMSVDCPSDIITFIRLGRPSISKSKLINTILSDTSHETFFNKNCPLGKTKRCVSDGLIEVAWYIPSGKAKNFSNITMVLNLRGDCKDHQPQLDFLSAISSVVVVFLELETLRDKKAVQMLSVLHNPGPSGIILAIDALKHDMPTIRRLCTEYYYHFPGHKQRTRMCIVAKNMEIESNFEVTKKMRHYMSDFLKKSTTQPLSETLQKKTFQFVKKDEDEEQIKQVRKMAIEILSCIPKDCLKVRNIITPLQGETWHIWSKHLKTINKSSKFTSLQDRAKFEDEMKEQRQKQLKMSRESHEFMLKCLDILLKVVDDDANFILLIEWVKHLLDDRSRTVIATCLRKYQADVHNLKSAKQEKKEQLIVDQLEQEAEKSKTVLAECSFRFEHIMREIGQRFEAIKTCTSDTSPSEKNLLERLPHIGAKLLLIGHPFEVMDGETTSIPMKWVEAVLLELRSMIGDKRLLALSVVGLQSSGKSTLLNTMFGLQFDVNVGRCTSGVYTQLVPVQSGECSFDYILVTDTEGLRAPNQGVNKELNHDNMLATFVIGLGDIAIVNVKGENTSEIKDILQISVHAFLRLKLANKRLNLRQSCIFVHQNVPAADAENKMIEERQMFVETLDEMAKASADQENIADIQTFSQVIDFDSEQNVSYFSDLWRGDPPMAPVNPGYSTRAAVVRNAILFRLACKRDTYLTITDTVSRIDDLWKGILKDDFVYSFRNSLELKAYNSVEREYHRIIWELDKFQCEYVLLKAREALLGCDNEDQLQKAVTTIASEFAQEVERETLRHRDQLVSFIEKNKLKGVMIQWKQTKLNRLKSHAEDLSNKSRTEINNLKEELRIEKIKIHERTKHENEINELARTLSQQMRGEKPQDDVMEQEFNSMWVKWLNKIDAKTTDEILSVNEQIKSLLCEKYPSDMAFFTCNNGDSNGRNYAKMKYLIDSLKSEDIGNEHISVRNMVNDTQHESDIDLYKKQAIDVSNHIFMKIDIRLEELICQDIRFDISYVNEILNIIYNDVQTHNEHTLNEYKFNLPTTYRAMIMNHVVQYVTVIFTTMNNKYDSKHSPRGQMEEYRRTAWTLFKNLVESKTEDMVAVGFFKETTMLKVKEQVSVLIPLDVADKIMMLFSNEKYSVMKAIMIDLAKNENFDDYKAYINDPASYARKWIMAFTNKTIFEESIGSQTQYCKLADHRLITICTQLEKSILHSTKECEGKENVGLCQWIDTFLADISISAVLPLPKDTFVHIKDRAISDLAYMNRVLVEEMGNMKHDIIKDFAETTKLTVKWKKDVVSIIMDKIWGCVETCMFCKEPCMNTDDKHDKYNINHHCIQHRPQGIGGFRRISDNSLVVDFCNFLIQSDTGYILNDPDDFFKILQRLYKEYKTHHPNWDIQPTYDTSKYWMYVLCKYQHQLKDLYNSALPHLPTTWNNITKEEAIDSL